MKIITSPVKKFPGTVTLSDPLNLIQCHEFERAIKAAQEIDITTDSTGYSLAVLPGIIACIESANLAGFPEKLTPENFPATPRLSSFRIIGWLISEISTLFAEADDPAEKKD